jgi:hypothetical protein
LQFDQGSANYITIIGEAPYNLNRLLTKEGLATNVVFDFRYRVKTIFGWSGFSPVLSVRTAVMPSAVPQLFFAIVDLLNVRVGWVAPYNGGSPIQQYTILF